MLVAMDESNDTNENLEDNINALLLRHAQLQNRLDQPSMMFGATPSRTTATGAAAGIEQHGSLGSGHQPSLAQAFDASSLSAENIALHQQQQALAIATAMASSSTNHNSTGALTAGASNTIEQHASMEGFLPPLDYQHSSPHAGSMMEQLLASSGGDATSQMQLQLAAGSGAGGAYQQHQQSMGLSNTTTNDLLSGGSSSMHYNHHLMTSPSANPMFSGMPNTSASSAQSFGMGAGSATLQQQLFAEQQHFMLLQQLLAANSVGNTTQQNQTGASGMPGFMPPLGGSGRGWEDHYQHTNSLSGVNPGRLSAPLASDASTVQTNLETGSGAPAQVISDNLQALEKILKKKQKREKPKRPLSAYNIFFKEERARILRTLPDTRRKKDVLNKDVDEDIYFEGQQEGIKESNTKQKEVEGGKQEADKESKAEGVGDDSKANDAVENGVKGDEEKTASSIGFDAKSYGTSAKHRSQRKKSPHGKISFESLAKQIGHNWKTLEPKRMSYYKKLADADMKRYKDDMAVFAAKKQAEREAHET